MPACFSMLLSVPICIPRTGCGSVTRPGFTGCLNCLWLPTCATSYQPSSFKRCMTSRLDIRHDTHFLHTCQVGIYRISAAILDRVLERGRFIYLDGRLGERVISTCNRSCRRVQTVPEFPVINWVWLLFGNEKSREKSGDFGRCRRGDGRKLPGYRGEGGISPGLALPFLVFSAGSRWRWAFCETPCIC